MTVATVIVLALGLGAAAAAESPSDVAKGAADDGVFVGPGRGRDVDEEALIRAVENARSSGLEVVAVLPADPQPTPSAFARRVQEQTEADAALVFPRDGPLETYVVEDLSAARIRATERARGFLQPAQAVEAFAAEVASERDTGTPAIVGRIINVVIVLALTIGVVVAIEQLISRGGKPVRST